jgi:PE-PPE domain
MQLSILRTTGLRLSSIAIGSMTNGDPQRGHTLWLLDEDHSRPLIKRALKQLRWLGACLVAGGSAGVMALISMFNPVIASADDIAFFIGGSGQPIPPTPLVETEDALFVNPLYPGYLPEPLFTPEGLYPLTGPDTLPLDTSVSEGVTILNDTIAQQVADGNNLLVYGLSQSAVIASEEMAALAALPAGQAPTTDQLSFVLVGDPSAPDGGLLTTFPGVTFPSIGATFGAATPGDTIYPTTIYDGEYDGFSDFPRYPLDLLADVNAMLGIDYVHDFYLSDSPSEIANAISLPTSAGYDGVTQYFMIPMQPGQDLPLLDPLQQLGVPQAFLDLVQPDLQVLINLGYGPDNVGYSLTPANVDTPFGLFPDVSWASVLDELETATQQGISQFIADLPSLGSQIEAFLDPSTLVTRLESLLETFGVGTDESILMGYTTAPDNLNDALTTIAATDNGALSATADLATALFSSLPGYDETLFENALQSGSVLDALLDPIAADLGLGSVIGWSEVTVIANALVEDLFDLSSLAS